MSKLVDKADFGPAGFKWMTLKRLKYTDPHGKLRVWESAERTSRHGNVDAVAIIARVTGKGQPPRLLLEAQYRPPQNNTVVEFPAGLIDANETAAQAAVRELKEETGYSGQVVEETPVCYADPGMSNANMIWVTVDVDADSPDNASVNPQLEEGEFIEVFMLPMDDLYTSLLDLQKKKGWDLDARLLGYALGLQQQQPATLHN